MLTGTPAKGTPRRNTEPPEASLRCGVQTGFGRHSAPVSLIGRTFKEQEKVGEDVGKWPPRTAGGTALRHAIGRANRPQLVKLTVCPYDPATLLRGELPGKSAESQAEDVSGMGKGGGTGRRQSGVPVVGRSR